jgi:nitrite reductase (NADH) small subunit
VSGDRFVRVGSAGDVPLLEGRSTTVGGRRIAVFRLRDGFAAIDAECPHRGGPLSDGIVAERCVSCPLHNWRFDLRTGAAAGGGAAGSVAVHEVIERDGDLYVRLARPPLAEAA